MSALSLAYFGQFHAAYDSEPLVRFGSNKVQALLIFLTVEAALHGRDSAHHHRREALMELLWPGLLPQSAQNNLRQTIFKLRQLIPTLPTVAGEPDEFLLSERLTVHLNQEAVYELDVAAFTRLLRLGQDHVHADLITCPVCCEQLQRAVALYRGEFLADFYLADSNDFEEWAANMRSRFRRQALDALDTVTEMMLAQGQTNQARQYAEQQLAIDNLHEGGYRQLMEVLALSGHPSEALACYAQLAGLLWDDLGMTPTEQTTALYEQIRAGELGLARPSPLAVRGYDLQEKIGSGAFGIVHLARQPFVNREVAVKIITPDLANQPDFIRRFEIEAQIIARLEHPYIVPLYDYWREPDAAYLVMRYLRGGNLQDVLAGGPLPVGRVEGLLGQICAGLHAAHGQDIVHRDIKPANILLDEAGNAYLSDFGIAKLMGSRHKLTGSRAVLGTLDYVSPEQFRDEPVSPASDIYSLGIVLFQMLTGRLPFPDASISELIYKHLHERVPAVSHLRTELPPAVDRVIWQATAAQPGNRFPDTMALALAFRGALQQSAPAEEVTVPGIARGAEVINPYQGLRPFLESDSDRFFGREALVERLLSCLAASPSPAILEAEAENAGAERFLAVVGPSGGGKSSVVRAGLIPALRRGELPGSENWFIMTISPGGHPYEELEAALLRVAVNPPPSLLEPLQKDERGLARTLKRVLPAADGDERPQLLLVIDQFEELFTLLEDLQVRNCFIAGLLTALQDSRSQLRLLITLRADFYDRPLQHPQLGELLRRRTELVLPLTAAELEQVVVRPAAQMGVRVEQGLVAAIAADVSDQPGALPTLQYALTELFEQRLNGLLTVEAYREIGGVSGALGRRADEIFAGLQPNEKLVARQLFLRLVTQGDEPGDGLPAPDTRRRVLQDELRELETPGVSGTQPLVDRIIETFGRSRLLTFDRDSATRRPTVEVAHEALLREWTRLRGWLGQYREDVRRQRRLAHSAAEWEQAGRDQGYLLRGSRIDQYAGWAAETRLALTSRERAFLHASLSARTSRLAEETARQQRELETAQQLARTEQARADAEQTRAEVQSRAGRRLRRLSLGLALVFLLAVGAAVIAGLQRNQAVIAAGAEATAAADAENQRRAADAQARLAKARELSASAIANLEPDPELSIMLALESLAVTHTQRAENVLHQAILLSPVEHALEHEQRVYGLAFSPDGERIVTISLHPTFWDAASGNLQAELTEHESVNDVAFSPDGSRIATAGMDRVAMLWDAHSRELLQTFEGHTNRVVDLEFNHDGSRLVTGSDDGLVKIWDVASGSELHTLADHTGPVINVAVAPERGLAAAVGPENTAARIWDLESGQQVAALEHGDLWDVEFGAGGERLATIDAYGTIQLWDVSGEPDSPGFGRALWTRTGMRLPASGLQWLAFTPDDSELLSINSDGVVVAFDATTGHLNRMLHCRVRSSSALAVSPDGRRLAVAGDDGDVKVCRLKQNYEFLTSTESQERLYDLAYTQDGSQLYAVGWDGVVRRYDLDRPDLRTDGVPAAAWEVDGQQLYVVTLSPDERMLAVGDRDGLIHVWDRQSGAGLVTLDNQSEAVSTLRFRPDGDRLLAGSFNGILQLWDLAQDRPLWRTTLDGPIWGAGFNRTGQVVVSTDYTPVIHLFHKLGDTDLYSLQTSYQGDFAAYTVEVSPDGSRLATGGYPAEIALWDMEDTGTTVVLSHAANLSGHSDLVADVAFSHDGSRLASAGSDNTVRVWDVATGEELLNLPGHTDVVWKVLFSPDDRYLATAGWDGSLRIYSLDLEELIALGYSRLSRWWTAAECRQYLHQDECPERPGS